MTRQEFDYEVAEFEKVADGHPYSKEFKDGFWKACKTRDKAWLIMTLKKAMILVKKPGYN